jgi:hypothetical protein
MPVRARSAALVVAIGNVVGFSGQNAVRVLGELAATVAPGGMLVVETVEPVSRVPKFIAQHDMLSWGSLLEKDFSTVVPDMLWQGFRPVASGTVPGSDSSEFEYMSPGEVARIVTELGLSLTDQMVSAPLTGGDPELVSRISGLGANALDRLVKLEVFAGRQRLLLDAGGHTLTCAQRPPP